MQRAVRAAKGAETTVFERISDGTRSLKKGDLVRVQGQGKNKPPIVGRILHFYVQKASTSKERLCYEHFTLREVSSWKVYV